MIPFGGGQQRPCLVCVCVCVFNIWPVATWPPDGAQDSAALWVLTNRQARPHIDPSICSYCTRRRRRQRPTRFTTAADDQSGPPALYSTSLTHPPHAPFALLKTKKKTRRKEKQKGQLSDRCCFCAFCTANNAGASGAARCPGFHNDNASIKAR